MKSVHGEKKHFLSFLKVFQLPETVSDLECTFEKYLRDWDTFLFSAALFRFGTYDKV